MGYNKMDLLLQAASWALIVTGCIFLLIGAIGILRMPDFYTRLHAAGMTDSFGAGLLLGGLLLHSGLSLTGGRLLLLVLFLLITSPIAAHALINAAYVSKLRMTPIEDRTQPEHKGEVS